MPGASRVVCAMSSAETSATNTRAPSARKRSAVRRPTLEPAPVTSTRRLAKPSSRTARALRRVLELQRLAHLSGRRDTLPEILDDPHRALDQLPVGREHAAIEIEI